MKHNNKIILVVDDEPNILISIEILLKKEGFTVYCAENGEQAVHLFKEKNPDVVLLDVMMPIMDGFATAAIIRSLDVESKSKIIMLTAKGTPKDRMTGYSLGADEYIVKPFENQDLLNKINDKFS